MNLDHRLSSLFAVWELYKKAISLLFRSSQVTRIFVYLLLKRACRKNGAHGSFTKFGLGHAVLEHFSLTLITLFEPVMTERQL